MTILEISDTAIKAYQVRVHRQRVSIVQVMLAVFEPGSSQQESAVKKLTGSRLWRSDEWMLSVSRRQVILKTLSLPSHADSELRRMIALQLIHFVPYSREDILFDYSIIGKDPQGYTKVLVTVMEKTLIHRWVRWLNDAGVPIHRIVVSSYGLAHWYAAFAKSSGPDAVLNLDAHATELCFVHEKTLTFARHLPFGLRDILAADHRQDRQQARAMEEMWIQQIRLSWDAYRMEQIGPPLRRIVLVMDAGLSPPIVDLLGQQLSLPVDIIDPYNLVTWERGVEVNCRERHDQSFVPALGFLMNPISRQPNLMPHEVLDTKRSLSRLKALIHGGVALISLIVFLGVALNFDIYRNARALKSLEARLTASEMLVTNAEKQINLMESLESKVNDRILVAPVLSRLMELAPEQVVFRAVQIDSAGVLSIQGFADTNNRVGDFQKSLISSPLFYAVTLQYVTMRKMFQQEYADFKIICSLKPMEGK
jgi:Tfp pilus assembly PilM family ATPase/Tfp pilus assembly protein PilN